MIIQAPTVPSQGKLRLELFLLTSHLLQLNPKLQRRDIDPKPKPCDAALVRDMYSNIKAHRLASFRGEVANSSIADLCACCSR